MLCQICAYTEVLLVVVLLVVGKICLQLQMLMQIVVSEAFLRHLLYGFYSEVVVVSSDKLQVFPWKAKLKELVLCITFYHSSMSHI